MTERSLQVTYRKGRTFAAYLHLSHQTGEKSARTVASPDGLLIVDYAASGKPLGVEITAPQAVPLDRLNQLLAELGEPPLTEQDYRPARAASRRWSPQSPSLANRGHANCFRRWLTADFAASRRGEDPSRHNDREGISTTW